MDIAFIAPYEQIRRTAQRIVDDKGYPAKVYMGNMEAGVREARKALRGGAKVLISRGWTARMIREALDIEVIDLRVSIYNILDYIHGQTTPQTRIALAGFESVISLAEPVCAILGRTYATFTFGGAVSSRKLMDSVEAWKPDVVVGDVIVGRLAEGRSLKFQLVESTEATMAEAFEHAMLVLNNMRRHVAAMEKVAAVLNCTKEGAMLVNSGGEIEEINPGGCALLRTTREKLLGSSFRQAFNSPELDASLKTGKKLKNALIRVMGQPFVVDLAIINPQEESGSAVIFFQEVKRVQETESNIRKKLFAKGFYAKYTFDDIIHRSPVMSRLIEVARAYSGTECNIMIQGETGTGKELFAQSIHNAGPLKDGPFVAVNCAALPGTLLESELFGYAPGAFTGALHSGKPGLFELAHNGTLFLDEITEMDIFLQSRLLRALQSKEIMRLGDGRIIPINVRIIAASNTVPSEAVAAGKLRADLFFRLNVLDLRIPPLREREGDAGHLFLHYLAVHGERRGIAVRKPPRRFLTALDAAPWHGNVRELENLAEKYVVLQLLPEGADIVSPSAMLPSGEYAALPRLPGRAGAVASPAERPAGGANGAGEDPFSLDRLIANHARMALEHEGGNISKAAARLGISRNTFKRRLARG